MTGTLHNTRTGAVLSAAVVRLAVDGVPLPATLLRSVTTVEVEQRLGRPAQLRVTLAGSTLEIADSLLAEDAEVRATVEGHDIELFSGLLTGTQRTWTADGSERLVIRAADRLDEMTRERHHQAFENMGPIDIADEIVSGYGLGFQSDRAAQAAVVTHQLAETDLAFLRRIIAPYGASLTLRGSTVHFVPADGIGATVQLRPGVDLHELSIDQRLWESAPTEVTGWHGGSAAGVASGAINPIGGWMLTQSDAERLAAARTVRDRVDRVVAAGVSGGDTRLRPGTPIELRDGPGRRAGGSLTDDPLVITSCTHRIDASSGYVCRFSTEPVDPPITAAPTICTLGIVVEVDDPDMGARVRVELAAFDSVTTDWIPVMCSGAGDGVGIVALPDIGASVLVLGPADAPGNGVVLGGLFGARDVPGPPVHDGRSATFIARLAGGGEFAIHDAASRIVVDNGAGSRFEMSPNEFRLHAASDMLISAPGRRLVISADTIDFERA